MHLMNCDIAQRLLDARHSPSAERKENQKGGALGKKLATWTRSVPLREHWHRFLSEPLILLSLLVLAQWRLQGAS